MQHNDSQRIVSLMSKVFRRRKLVIVLSVLAILAPIIYYNETTTPMYHANTSLIFEDFSTQVSTYSYDVSREIMLSNRLEEIKSLAFSEDITRALPLDVYDLFSLPPDAAPGADKFSYVSWKINRSLDAYSIRGSNVLQISVEMSKPVLCRDIANTAAKVFEERMYRVKKEGVSGVRNFIEDQLVRVQEQLNQTEEELKNFKEANKIISIDKESQGLLRKTTEAEVLYNQIKTQRGSVQERLQSLKQSLTKQKKDLVPSITDIATPYTQKLKEKLIALQQQYTDLRLQGYTEDHPKLSQLLKEIDSTKKSLTDEAVKISRSDNLIDPIALMEKNVNEVYSFEIELETLRAQEAALKSTIREYESNLATLPEKEYVLARLTRQKEVMAKNYMMLLEKREEARISEAARIASIRVIDEARLPFEPISPRKTINIAIGIVLGLLIGFGIAFIREVNDGTLDSTEELEELTSWHVLASIPAIQNSANGRFALRNRSPNGEAKGPLIKKSLIAGVESKTGVGETYRMLRTNLQFLGLGEKHKTILLTSIGPDEGKSTTMANLSIALAKMEQKVLIVDSDLRRPVVHSLFDLDKEPGLSDLLVYHSAMRETPGLLDDNSVADSMFKEDNMGELVDNFSDFVLDNQLISNINNMAKSNTANILNNSLIEAVQSTRIENLKALTSGKQLKNPSETVASLQMKTLLDELKNKFDIILIDSAPLLLVPETMVLSSLVDGVVFVVDARKYNKEMILKAKGLLTKAKANVLGTVLNNVEIDSKNKGNYYYYDA